MTKMELIDHIMNKEFKEGDYITFCLMGDGFNKVRFESIRIHHFTNEYVVGHINSVERKFKMKNMFAIRKIDSKKTLTTDEIIKSYIGVIPPR